VQKREARATRVYGSCDRRANIKSLNKMGRQPARQVVQPSAPPDGSPDAGGPPALSRVTTQAPDEATTSASGQFSRFGVSAANTMGAAVAMVATVAAVASPLLSPVLNEAPAAFLAGTRTGPFLPQFNGGQLFPGCTPACVMGDLRGPLAEGYAAATRAAVSRAAGPTAC
jgi:hypothetical protein